MAVNVEGFRRFPSATPNPSKFILTLLFREKENHWKALRALSFARLLPASRPVLLLRMKNRSSVENRLEKVRVHF